MKPRIRWWGNGDVLASCFRVYRRCYPNNLAVFRTEPQSPPKEFRVLSVPLVAYNRGKLND